MAGTNPLGYTTFRQDFGNLTASYSSAFYGLFVQDDWQITDRVKVLCGVRFDLFDVPTARAFAPNPYSQDFTIDKNNWGRARRVVVARQPGANGAASVDRPDVRAAAARFLRQRDPE